MATPLTGLLDELESCGQNLLSALTRESSNSGAIIERREELLRRLQTAVAAGATGAVSAEQAQRLAELETKIAQAGRLWRAKLMTRLTQCRQRRGMLDLAGASAGPAHKRLILKA